MPVTDESLNAALLGRSKYYADQIEAAGDFVGPNDMALSNRLWALAGAMREYGDMITHPRRYSPVELPSYAPNHPFYRGGRVRVINSPFGMVHNGDVYTITDVAMAQDNVRFVITTGTALRPEEELYFQPEEIEVID
jgi:hypothetical protein